MNMITQTLSMRLVSIGANEYLSIMEYDEIDKTGDDEIDGVNWLDTMEHMRSFMERAEQMPALA